MVWMEAFRSEVFTGRFGDCPEDRSWLVTPMIHDCYAGLYGEPGFTKLAPCVEANKDVEVDPVKLQRLVSGALAHDRKTLKALCQPIIIATYDGMGWAMDGHHRIKALGILGAEDIACFLLPEGAAEKYRITLP